MRLFPLKEKKEMAESSIESIEQLKLSNDDETIESEHMILVK